MIIRRVRDDAPDSRWRRVAWRSGIALRRIGGAIERGSWRWSGMRAALFGVTGGLALWLLVFLFVARCVGASE